MVPHSLLLKLLYPSADTLFASSRLNHMQSCRLADAESSALVAAYLQVELAAGVRYLMAAPAPNAACAVAQVLQDQRFGTLVQGPEQIIHNCLQPTVR